jgi:hypothetical protein
MKLSAKSFLALVLLIFAFLHSVRPRSNSLSRVRVGMPPEACSKAIGGFGWAFPGGMTAASPELAGYHFWFSPPAELPKSSAAPGEVLMAVTFSENMNMTGRVFVLPQSLAGQRCSGRLR